MHSATSLLHLQVSVYMAVVPWLQMFDNLTMCVIGISNLEERKSTSIEGLGLVPACATWVVDKSGVDIDPNPPYMWLPHWKHSVLLH
jgi:hypothetical protein